MARDHFLVVSPDPEMRGLLTHVLTSLGCPVGVLPAEESALSPKGETVSTIFVDMRARSRRWSEACLEEEAPAFQWRAMVYVEDGDSWERRARVLRTADAILVHPFTSDEVLRIAKGRTRGRWAPSVPVDSVVHKTIAPRGAQATFSPAPVG